MDAHTEIGRVAIVGTGLIGSSWAACFLAHGLNPPHLVPLVEVVGGAKTSAETIERVMRFYSAVGKRAMHIRKEVMGHVANRLSAALYREVAYLIDQDVVSVEDADAAARRQLLLSGDSGRHTRTRLSSS